MKAYTYLGQGKAALLDKPEPQLQGPRDALVRVTLGSICTSDLHILHGSVPRAVPGITLGHEMVGVVEAVGSAVGSVRPGDRVAQAEYVRVPYADQGLTLIPDGVSDAQALFTGDLLATGFWAARISEIVPEEDTVLIIGAGPTGICTLLCVMLRAPPHHCL